MAKKKTNDDIRELVDAYTQLPEKYREQARVFLFYLQCVAFPQKPQDQSCQIKTMTVAKVKKLFAQKQSSLTAKRLTDNIILDEIQKHRNGLEL